MEAASTPAATLRRLALLMLGLLMIVASVAMSTTNHPAVLRLQESTGAAASQQPAP